MKKRFPAFFLALALCFGLAVPAFAVDGSVSSSGSFVFDMNNPEMDIDFVWHSGLYEPVDLWVRNCNCEYRSEEVREEVSWGVLTYRETYLYISYDKQERLYVATDPGVHGLPSGTAFTVKGIQSTNMINISLYADPDGDGVYDQQLLSNDSEKGIILVPPAARYGQEFFSAGSIYDVTADKFSADAIGIQTEKGSDGLLSFTVDSDGVYQVFGGNTLIWWHVDEPLKAGGFRSLAEGALLISKDESLPGAPAPTFTDVPGWCEDAVNWAVDENITSGTGDNQFSPLRTCTHAEILTFLWRAKDEPAAKAKAPFTVASYFQDAVDWAYGEGLIGASTDTTADCTRADAVNYIWKASNQPDAHSGSFSDVPAGASYAPAVNWAVEIGVTAGTNDGSTFSPDKTCTRGEIVTFLHRTYVPEVRLV